MNDYTVELYEEIVDNYFVLIKELGVDSFKTFSFISYDYCRKITIDGIEYDFDSEFCHDDTEATEALCAIDCLISDSEEDEEKLLRKIEEKINLRNKN